MFFYAAEPRIVVCRGVAGIAFFFFFLLSIFFAYAVVGEQLAECHETSSRMSLTGRRTRFEAEGT